MLTLLDCSSLSGRETVDEEEGGAVGIGNEKKYLLVKEPVAGAVGSPL